MGSIRRMSSLRSMRSSPLKERRQEQIEHTVEPAVGSSYMCRVIFARPDPQGPQSPYHGTKLSLALNFQQSPPDRPIFDVVQRKRSASSSLAVQRSSPVPIPTPAKQEDPPLGVPVHSTDLPTGTVPNSPGPLQTALYRESNHSDIPSDMSPVRAHTESVPEHIPTPMPGTNQGFSDNDLAEVSQGQRRASSPESQVEPSDYFNIPVAKDSRCTYPNDAIRAADRHYPRVYRCDPSLVRCKHDQCETDPADDESTGERIYTRCRVDERESLGTNSSSLNIEHTVFEDRSEHIFLGKCDPTRIEYNEKVINTDIGAPDMPTTDVHNRVMTSREPQFQHAESQIVLQMKAHQWRASYPQARAAQHVSRMSSPSRWGTHGSLYDGTGYGDTSSSNSTRLSTSSTGQGVPEETVDREAYTKDSLARGCATIARDYDNLEDAIRAYAALEAKRSSTISDNVLEDVVTEAQADVDLANEMAENTLGA
jgi:hypothetical protein